MLNFRGADAVRQRPNAPWVEVWLSPQTMVVPGQGKTLLGADHVHDALPPVELVKNIRSEFACVSPPSPASADAFRIGIGF